MPEGSRCQPGSWLFRSAVEVMIMLRSKVRRQVRVIGEPVRNLRERHQRSGGRFSGGWRGERNFHDGLGRQVHRLLGNEYTAVETSFHCDHGCLLESHYSMSTLFQLSGGVNLASIDWTVPSLPDQPNLRHLAAAPASAAASLLRPGQGQLPLRRRRPRNLEFDG